MGGPHPKDCRDTIHLLRLGSAVPKDNNTEVPPPQRGDQPRTFALGHNLSEATKFGVSQTTPLQPNFHWNDLVPAAYFT